MIYYRNMKSPYPIDWPEQLSTSAKKISAACNLVVLFSSIVFHVFPWHNIHTNEKFESLTKDIDREVDPHGLA